MVSITRSLAIELAKGDFIGFIDSDGLIDKSIFEKIYNYIVKSNFDIGVCGYREIDFINK